MFWPSYERNSYFDFIGNTETMESEGIRGNSLDKIREILFDGIVMAGDGVLSCKPIEFFIHKKQKRTLSLLKTRYTSPLFILKKETQDYLLYFVPKLGTIKVHIKKYSIKEIINRFELITSQIVTFPGSSMFLLPTTLSTLSKLCHLAVSQKIAILDMKKGLNLNYVSCYYDKGCSCVLPFCNEKIYFNIDYFNINKLLSPDPEYIVYDGNDIKAYIENLSHKIDDTTANFHLGNYFERMSLDPDLERAPMLYDNNYMIREKNILKEMILRIDLECLVIKKTLTLEEFCGENYRPFYSQKYKEWSAQNYFNEEGILAQQVRKKLNSFLMTDVVEKILEMVDAENPTLKTIM